MKTQKWNRSYSTRAVRSTGRLILVISVGKNHICKLCISEGNCSFRLDERCGWGLGVVWGGWEGCYRRQTDMDPQPDTFVPPAFWANLHAPPTPPPPLPPPVHSQSEINPPREHRKWVKSPFLHCNPLSEGILVGGEAIWLTHVRGRGLGGACTRDGETGGMIEKGREEETFFFFTLVLNRFCRLLPSNGSPLRKALRLAWNITKDTFAVCLPDVLFDKRTTTCNLRETMPYRGFFCLSRWFFFSFRPSSSMMLQDFLCVRSPAHWVAFLRNER